MLALAHSLRQVAAGQGWLRPSAHLLAIDGLADEDTLLVVAVAMQKADERDSDRHAHRHRERDARDLGAKVIEH